MNDEYESFVTSTRCLCTTCHARLSEVDRQECFRCRVGTVGFVFRGGGHMYGRSNFSERTNAEFVNEHIGDVKRDGIAHMGSQEWQG